MKYKLPSGHIGLIDKQDSYLLEDYNWHLVNGYIQTDSGSRKLGTRRYIRMHRLILSPKHTELVDHKNRNPLDNRRKNLRVSSKSTNGMNRRAQANNTSGYKGVSFCKKSCKWRAYISKNKKWRHLGLYKTPEAASQAYKNAARLLHKEFLCI